jgi:serine/threonine protein kinase
VSAEDRLEPNVTPGPNQGGLGPTEVWTPEETAGTVIGRYHLLQKIGEGGMGEIWLAEQKEPVRRRVAIKLIKAGMDTREVVARFESERQALAPDGPPRHRQGVRCRIHAARRAVLRDGVRRRRSHHNLLR